MPTSDSLSASWQEPPVEVLASTHKKRILVVDDHALVRAGFRQLIDRTDDLEVGGEAGTAAAALDLAMTEEFDVAPRAADSHRQHARRGAIRGEPAARRSERVLSQGR